MSEDRFILLDAGASRPTGVPLPSWRTVKADVADTGGRFTLTEDHGGEDDPPHVHDTFDEIVYVLDGELGVESDGVTHRLTEGMCAFLPRGVPHAVRSLSDAPAHALHLCTPGVPYDARSAPTTRHVDESRFYVLAKGEARPGRLRVPPAFSCKVRSADTEDRLSLLEMVVAQAIPRHVHHRADESIYVLDGELLVEFADRIHRATPGQFVLLPHGVRHALSPGSTPPPRVLQISSPGGWECFVEDLIEARPHITINGRFDPRKLNPIAAKYEITYEEPSDVADPSPRDDVARSAERANAADDLL